MKPIVITGFMGSGKTRVARELARRLEVSMIDLDERIRARAGRSPAQLIVEDGEAVFRSVETQMLREVLASGEAKVIALGGGAWIQAPNRQLVDEYGCLSVWLDVPFEKCWSRIEASDEDRPLGKTREQAFALYEQRRPVYQLARVHIDFREEDFNDLVSRIIALTSFS
jgi:shikimate kinase